MTRRGKYPVEIREQAVRMVFEHQAEHASQCAVPADDRLRLHHHRGGTPAGPIPGAPRPEETVGWLRSSASALTGQHGELLPKGQVLEHQVVL